MFTKAGKHFADWTDADGHRRRKSFTNKAKAKAHEDAMKEARNPQRARAVSPASSRRNKELASIKRLHTVEPSHRSRPLEVISSRANGGRVKLQKQST